MQTEYKPGEIITQSGIYKVIHDNNHHEDHEVTLIKNHTFPPCNHCGKHPRFVLVRAAIHISSHKLF